MMHCREKVEEWQGENIAIHHIQFSSTLLSFVSTAFTPLDSNKPKKRVTSESGMKIEQ